MTSSLMTAQVTLSGFIMCNLSYGGAFLPVFILLLLILSIFFFSLPRSPFSNCVRQCIDINPCCILSLPAFERNINPRSGCLPRSTKCKLICRSNTAVKSDILLVLYSQRIVKENESHTDFLISPTPFFSSLREPLLWPGASGRGVPVAGYASQCISHRRAARVTPLRVPRAAPMRSRSLARSR